MTQIQNRLNKIEKNQTNLIISVKESNDKIKKCQQLQNDKYLKLTDAIKKISDKQSS